LNQDALNQVRQLSVKHACLKEYSLAQVIVATLFYDHLNSYQILSFVEYDPNLEEKQINPQSLHLIDYCENIKSLT
jgi:hypothetical protein